MRFSSKLSLAMLTAAGMFFGSPVLGFDDPAREGLIRISDKQPSPQPVPDPVSSGNASGTVSGGEYAGDCEDDGDGGWCNCPKYQWPDYGYARIVKHPIHRMPVQYYRYWPKRWYGEPGSGIAPNAQRFPVIYMPTDTTQLGVYYQRVPQWLPNPAMLPPAPWPTHWHRRECAYNDGCSPNGMQGPMSESNGPTPVTPAEPTPGQTAPVEPPAEPPPSEPTPVDPTPMPPKEASRSVEQSASNETFPEPAL